MDSLPKSILFDIGVSRRSQLSVITGVSSKVAQKAIDYYNNENGFNDNPPPDEPIEGTKRGRPKKSLDDEQRKRLKDIVHGLNTSGATCTSTVIQNHLEVGYNVRVERPTLLRQLKASGFKYSKGNRLNKEHDSPANVQYRKRYVEERLSNLDANGAPIRPEVFLDESYIHVNHNLDKGWIDLNANVFQQDKGAMIVIFGAFVVWRDQDNNRTTLSIGQQKEGIEFKREWLNEDALSRTINNGKT